MWDMAGDGGGGGSSYFLLAEDPVGNAPIGLHLFSGISKVYLLPIL
jgi:hypothetical protein